MPEVVRTLSEPLSKVDRITVVSTGNDAAVGVNKVTGNIAKMAAQIPGVFDAFRHATGTKPA